MARHCSICIHDKRAEIELSVANGLSNRRIASQHGMSEAAIRRHMAEHIKQATKVQQEAKEISKKIDVMKQLLELNAVARSVMTRNYADKKDTLVLAAIDRIQKQLELAAKLQGDLDESTKIDISLHPDFQMVQQRILSALDKCPQDVKLLLVEAISPQEEFHAHLN